MTMHLNRLVMMNRVSQLTMQFRPPGGGVTVRDMASGDQRVVSASTAAQAVAESRGDREGDGA